MTLNRADAGRPTPEPGLWKPVLLRALIALGFGLLTVFWPDVPSFVAGIYLIFSGIAVVSLNLAVQHGLKGSALLLRTESIVLAACGILALVAPGAIALALGVGLLLSGVLEILLGLKFRLQTVLGRDWLITGGVAALAGILLFVLANGSPRAPLGVTGGSAVIIGVVLVLAALSYRHDGARPMQSGTAGRGGKQSLPGVE